MNPTRLAIAWCTYTIFFLVLAEWLDNYISEEWILELLSISKHDERGIELGARLSLYFTLTLILIIITTKYAYTFTGLSEWQHGSKTKKTIKLIAIWCAFLVPFFVIVFLLHLVLPEVWLYQLIMKRKGRPFDNVVWDGIFMGITFALALPINGAVVAFVSAREMQFKQLRQSAQQKTTDQTADP
jgi:ABC-type Fe3+ transport system permease subunit